MKMIAIIAIALLAISMVSAETVVVQPGDMATSFADVFAEPTSWFFYNDQTDTIDNTLGSFILGPDTPPTGSGSVEIEVSGQQRRNLATYQFAGTKLADITELKFSTYNPQAGNGGSADRSAYLNFNVDFDGSDTWQRRLAFVPSQNNIVTQDAWQEWDAINSGNALWWWSGYASSGNMWPDGNIAEYRTWTNLTTSFPNISIRTTDSWLGLRVGEPYVSGYTENLDTFVFGTAIETTTVDFETNDCTFIESGMTLLLYHDCITTQTIEIPDGYTIDGQGYTITAVDSNASTFVGPIITNAGTTANVINLGVTTDNLAVACKSGDDRLRGIMFDGASGLIKDNIVTNIFKGPSGCQEGNAIEVRNAPFDGTGNNTQFVEVRNNELDAWQKGGIICNGDVDCTIENNNVGESASNKYLLAPNSVQVAYGARATVMHNNIEGSSWCGPSNYVGTAMLLFDHADGTIISQNNIKGDSDIGIYNFGGETTIDNNKVFEDKDALDCNQFGYDYGIGNWGAQSDITNNKVKGFDVNYNGVTGGKNKQVSGPNGPNAENPFW